MTKSKFYIIIIVGLLISNILLIWTLIGKKPPHPPFRNPEGPKNIIIERLNFSEEQIDEYEDLILDHRAKIHDFERDLVNLKQELYSELNQDDFTPDSLLAEISKIQSNIEQAHFDHFVEIKKLCSEEQQIKFDDLSKELARLFQPPKPPNEKRHP